MEPKILVDQGDALEAEVVSGQARKVVQKPGVRNSAHGYLERYTLEGTVTCVIEKPLRLKIPNL